jgi:hypothetical protein
MSSGRLGAVDILATTNTAIYSVPSGKVATVNINVCNRNAAEIAIRLAVLDGAIGTLANEDYIEYDVPMFDNGVLERTGIVISDGQTVVAYSDTANVSVQVWGWEEDA